MAAAAHGHVQASTAAQPLPRNIVPVLKPSEVVDGPEEPLPAHVLDPQQKAVLEDLLARRGHVVVLGIAGSGKSAVLRRYLRDTGATARLVLGPTWQAVQATRRPEAKTIHGALACGLDLKRLADGHVLAVHIKNMQKNRQQMPLLGSWRRADELVIDEIGFVSAEAFEVLEQFARCARDSERPFGGLRVVLVGDNSQLAPIEGKFWFEASVWRRIQDRTTTHFLNEAHRHGNAAFASALGELRTEKCNPTSLYRFLEPLVATESEALDLLLQTDGRVLVPTQGDRAHWNELVARALLRKQAEDRSVLLVRFVAQNGLEAVADEAAAKHAHEWRDHCPADPVVALFTGAKVRFTTSVCFGPNHRPYGPCGEIHTGDYGIVTGFVYHDHSENTYIPLGADGVPEGLHAIWPVIRLANGAELVLGGEYFASPATVIDGKKVPGDLATRIQLPIRLAYAQTVHSAQGATLANGVVQVAGFWEHAHLYVSLSRFSSLQGLRVFVENPREGEARATWRQRAHNGLWGALLEAKGDARVIAFEKETRERQQREQP